MCFRTSLNYKFYLEKNFSYKNVLQNLTKPVKINAVLNLVYHKQILIATKNIVHDKLFAYNQNFIVLEIKIVQNFMF